jgi:hypothetical protein
METVYAEMGVKEIDLFPGNRLVEGGCASRRDIDELSNATAEAGVGIDDVCSRKLEAVAVLVSDPQRDDIDPAEVPDLLGDECFRQRQKSMPENRSLVSSCHVIESEHG